MFGNLDIALYLNITLYSILGLGAFFGFLKGFKKSLFSFITTAIFFIAFFLTIDLVVNYLWTVQFAPLGQAFGLIDGSLSGATSFSEVTPMALQLYFGAEYGTVILNPHFLELATGLGIFALKLVYTLLYFTIFFVIYKLFCLIIRSIIMGGHKNNERYASKNRVFGLLFGVLEGGISLYVTLIILGGFMSITDSLVTLAPTTPDEEIEMVFPRDHLYEASYTVLAESVIPEIPAELTAMIEELRTLSEAYNNNIIVQYSSQIDITDEDDVTMDLNVYLFDEVLSFDYNEQKVSLRSELSTFASVGNYVLSMEYATTNDITDITGDNIRDVFGLLAASDLLVSIVPLGIEIGAVMMEAPLSVPTEDLYAIDWETELNQLGVIAATAFDIVSQIGILEGDPNYEEMTIDGDTMRNLFDQLAESNLMTLAAYVAIEPLLVAGGDQVQAVMTLPVGVEWTDINWVEEFTAIGAILGAVLDTDVTYSQLTSGNLNVIINAVATIDFTVLLESEIVTYALINVLSGAAGIEGLDMIVIPDGIVWLDEFDGDGNLLVAGELRNILSAINAMTSVLGDFDIENLSPSLLTDLSDESIDTIFESQVLVATLSGVLLGIDLGDQFTLIVPDTAVDEDFYIIKEEMKSMVKAVKLIMVLPVCEVDDPECENAEPDYLGNALGLTDAEIDILLSSQILNATVGNLLNEMGGEELVVPNSVLNDVSISYPLERRDEVISVISSVEIKKVFQAVTTFGITDIASLNLDQLDASFLDNLESETVPGTVDEDKLTRIFASGVIHATISKVLLDMMGEAEAFISVPYFSELEAEVRYTDDGLDYIHVDELKAAFRALYSLNITDFTNIEASFNLQTVLDNIDLLLDSSILHATISKQLLDLAGDTVVIPTMSLDDVAIQIEVGDVLELTNTTYIARSELIAIFDVLSLLGITDINNVASSMDASIISNLEDDLDPTILSDDKLDDLFGSVIIHATISDMLLDLMTGDTAFVVVPTYGLDELNQEIEIKDSAYGTDYINEDELKNVLKALHSLDITDFDTIESSFTLDLILAHIDELLASSILHATVSKQLLDMQGDPIIVPTQGIDDSFVQITVGDPLELTDTTYITRSELESIFDALDILGINDIDTVTFDATIISNLEDTLDDDEDGITLEELSDDKLATLFASYIIHATISDMLIDLTSGDNPFVVVPTYGLDELNQEINVKESAYGTEYISKIELQNVLKALHALDITDFDTMETALTLQVILDNIDILLESSILHSTVSKQLLDMNGDAIVVPSQSLDDAFVQIEVGDPLLSTDTLYITREELRAVFDALDILNITDIETVTFDASIINNLEDTLDDDGDLITNELSDDKLSVLFSSVIIHATISDMLYDLTSGDDPFVVVPTYGLDELNAEIAIKQTAYLTDYVNKTELEAVLKALYALDISDFDTMESTLTLQVILTNIDILLDSSILHSTVSKKLLDMEVSGTLIIPDTDPMDQEVTILTGDPLLFTDTLYITREELRAVFDALEVLGISDIETVSFDAGIISNLEDIDDDDTDGITLEELSTIKLNTLFASIIIHATISDMLIDLTSGGEAFVVVPNRNAIDSTDIKFTSYAVDYIDENELKHVLIAMHALDIQDFNTIESSITLNDINTNIDAILSSSILHASMSKQLLDLQTGGSDMTVPYFDENNDPIRLLVSGTNYITDAELRAVFNSLSILGINDVNAFDGSVTLATIDIGTNAQDVVSSSILQATFSKTVLDIAIGGTLIVPYYAENDTTQIRITVQDGLPEETNYIKATELADLLIALKVLGYTDSSAFSTGFTGSVDLSNISQVNVNTGKTNAKLLVASAIIQATVSEKVYDLALAGTIIVPTHAIDGLTEVQITVQATLPEETKYISKLELEHLLLALDVLGMASGDISAYDGSISLANLYSNEPNQNILLSSASIHATISDQIFDLKTAGTLIVPDMGYNDLAIDVTVLTNYYVYDYEIKALMNAMEVLSPGGELDSFTGSFDLSLLYDDEANQNLLLASSSIHATISDQIFGLDTGGSIAVPIRDVSSVTIQILKGTFTYIKSSEIKNLLNAIGVLNPAGGSLDTFSGNISLSSLYNNEPSQDKLLLSAIIHATISDQIMSLDTGGQLKVPNTNVANTPIQELVFGTTFVYDFEIKALINALSVLDPDGGDLSGFGGNISLSSLYNNEPSQDKLLLSASIHATISEQVLDLSTGGQLVVPDTTVAGTAIQELISGTDFVYDFEIKALINALSVLSPAGGDLSGFGGNISLSSLYNNEPSQDLLLLSATIHATISDQILDLSTGGSLVVPSQNVSGTAIREVVGGTDFVYDFEIKALINGLSVLDPDGGDLSSFNGAIGLDSLFGNTANQDKLLLSASIHATISDQILTLSTSGDLTVPVRDVDNTLIQETVDTTPFIYATEIKRLIDALDIIGFSGNMASFDGTISITQLSGVDGDTNQNTLLLSAIMHATVSDTLMSIDSSVLIVPQYKADELTQVKIAVLTTEFVLKGEIKALINALTIMGYTDLNSFGVAIDSTKFFDDPATLLLSSSIQATISNRLINGTGGNLIVPNTDAENGNAIIRFASIHDGTLYITVEEITEILAALDMLGMTNFATLDISISAMFGPGVDFATLLESASVQATISDSILEFAIDEDARVAGNSDLVVPNELRDDVVAGIVNIEIIENDELFNLLNALKMLGFTDFGDAVDATIITDLTGPQLDTILLSGSMHVTIDNMLKGNPNITVPNKALVGGNTTTAHYGITGLIQANEIKYFILAANTVGGASFATVDFDYNAIASLDAGQQTTVLTSMIVRNMITPDLVSAVNTYNDVPVFLGGPNPVLYDPIPNSMYEDEDNSTFLTAAAILILIDYLP